MPETPEPFLSTYDRGEAAYRASQSDPRFGYFSYIPKSVERENAADYQICVIIHGSARTPHIYRNLFKDFAERNNYVILAPMFPVGITDSSDQSSYKFLKAGDIRYDSILLDMVGELSARVGVRGDRFLLHGFSGGGHFVHRFFYLHASRIKGLSIAAPGMVTLLNEKLAWHCGVKDLEETFGAPIAWDAMRSVPVQMIVGADDLETWEITISRDNRYWMPEVNNAGKTRPDRLKALRDSFENAGISVQYEEVPGVAHEGYRLVDPVIQFFQSLREDHGPS